MQYELASHAPIKNEKPKKKCLVCTRYYGLDKIGIDYCVMSEEHQEWWMHPECIGPPR